MFGNKDGKPVAIVITEHTYIEGKLVMQGEELDDVAADLAMELAGAGKARIKPPAPAKGKKAAAEA